MYIYKGFSSFIYCIKGNIIFLHLTPIKVYADEPILRMFCSEKSTWIMTPVLTAQKWYSHKGKAFTWDILAIYSQFLTCTVPHKPIPLMFSGAELAK